MIFCGAAAKEVTTPALGAKQIEVRRTFPIFIEQMPNSANWVMAY
jgi:hypothetical protein